MAQIWMAALRGGLELVNSAGPLLPARAQSLFPVSNPGILFPMLVGTGWHLLVAARIWRKAGWVMACGPGRCCPKRYGSHGLHLSGSLSRVEVFG